MGTHVRDAVVDHLKHAPEGKYLTADELSEKLKTDRNSTASTCYQLGKRAVLTRRKRDGSTAYEYAAGKRIAYGEKYAGRKFPFHHKNKRGAATQHAVPAASGDVGIVVKLDGQAHAITLAQAKQLFVDLKTLFG